MWQRVQPEFNLILEALVAFDAIYEDLRVPALFMAHSGAKARKGLVKV